MCKYDYFKIYYEAIIYILIINFFKKKYKNKLKLKYNKIPKKELFFTKGTNSKLNKFINFEPKKYIRNILNTYHD